MTILATVYASAPAAEVIIPALEIRVPGKDPIRVCGGYEDHTLGVGGSDYLFKAAPIAVSLPKRDTSGQQNLAFAVAGLDGTEQAHIEAALEDDELVEIVYLEYLASDKTAPARVPLVMVVVGGVIEGMEAKFEASFYDLLNSAWPRERYTAESAPGLKYL